MASPSPAADQIAHRLLQLPADDALALIFPGQGSQKTGMGAEVCEASPAAREVFALADETLGFEISTVCQQGPDDELTKTANTQPAILTTSLAILATALESGALARCPRFTAGHSLGQYTALVAAGSLAPADAISLVRERGRLMGEAKTGTMAAVVGLEADAVEALCRETGAEVANYNGPTQTVVGGEPAAVEKACELAKERGGRGLPVNVSGAFHTSLMAPAAREFARFLDEVTIADPRIPAIGNLTARPLTTADEVRTDLREQIRAPVRWYQSMNHLESVGVRDVIELGPNRLLTTQLKRSNPDLEATSLDEAAALKAASSV